MNILLQSLLLLGGINLIAARYIHWGSAPLFPLEGDLYRSPISQYNHGVGDYGRFHKFFDEYSDDDLSKEPVISETSDELDLKQLKEFESFLSTLMGDYEDEDNVDERKIADASKEITNEKNDDDKSDNDDDTDDKNEKNDDDKSDNDDDKDDKNEKNDDDKSENNDDKSDNDDKNDNDDDDNNDDNDTKEDKEEEEEAEIIDNSNEENPVKPIVTVDESLFLVQDGDDDDTEHVEAISVENVPLEKHELSEKEIRELTAFLVTLSTMEDLLKVAEHIEDEDNSKDAEELFELKLKEVDNFMGLFVNTLDAILEETSEVGKDTKKSENDDDNDNDNDKEDKDDSKDDNDNDNDNDNDDKKEKEASIENEDASVSMEFHSVDSQTNTQNMDTHKYNLVERSTTTAHDFKPTSSPYTPESYSSPGNPNAAIIREYVEEREQLDELQENLLANKLNMDKDFYHIIANEGDDKELQKFGNDIAAMRENIFQMKQSIEAMQDIKSKLYFHQLIKSALKDAQN